MKDGEEMRKRQGRDGEKRVNEAKKKVAGWTMENVKLKSNIPITNYNIAYILL